MRLEFLPDARVLVVERQSHHLQAIQWADGRVLLDLATPAKDFVAARAGSVGLTLLLIRKESLEVVDLAREVDSRTRARFTFPGRMLTDAIQSPDGSRVACGL